MEGCTRIGLQADAWMGQSCTSFFAAFQFARRTCVVQPFGETPRVSRPCKLRPAAAWGRHGSPRAARLTQTRAFDVASGALCACYGVLAVDYGEDISTKDRHDYMFVYSFCMEEQTHTPSGKTSPVTETTNTFTLGTFSARHDISTSAPAHAGNHPGNEHAWIVNTSDLRARCTVVDLRSWDTRAKYVLRTGVIFFMRSSPAVGTGASFDYTDPCDDCALDPRFRISNRYLSAPGQPKSARVIHFSVRPYGNARRDFPLPSLINTVPFVCGFAKSVPLEPCPSALGTVTMGHSVACVEPGYPPVRTSECRPSPTLGIFPGRANWAKVICEERFPTRHGNDASLCARVYIARLSEDDRCLQLIADPDTSLPALGFLKREQIHKEIDGWLLRAGRIPCPVETGEMSFPAVDTDERTRPRPGPERQQALNMNGGQLARITCPAYLAFVAPVFESGGVQRKDTPPGIFGPVIYGIESLAKMRIRQYDNEMRLVLWTVCLLLVSGWGALADEPDSPEDEFMFPPWDGDNRILNIGQKNFKKAVKDSEVLIVLFSADFDEHSEGDTQEEVSEYALQVRSLSTSVFRP
ncbi:hypothetical protein Bbelb_436530 [Branchiostoma belcheri]|nr:hypothetical protein Bbelb_436530 [Branchiostoma belcheri]